MRAAKWLGRGHYLNNVFGGVPGSGVGAGGKGQKAIQHRLKLRSVSRNDISKKTLIELILIVKYNIY
jgi:hypothetical protein